MAKITSIRSCLQTISDPSFDQTSLQSFRLKCHVIVSRSSKSKIFLQVTDGSTSQSIHVFIDSSTSHIKIGDHLDMTGHFVITPDRKQSVEFIPSSLVIYTPDESITPAQVAQYQHMYTTKTIQSIRDCHHIRPANSIYASIYRIRSKMLKAVSDYFDSKEIIRVDPNIFSKSDCEGAGESFSVQFGTKTEIKCDSEIVEVPEIYQLQVSSQLPLEWFTRCFSSGVYTMNPSFRAEKSMTRRHLACFTHLEWEQQFDDLSQLMDFSEDLVKSLYRTALATCKEDIEFVSPTSLATIGSYCLDGLDGKEKPWSRMTYTQAIDICHAHADELKKYFDLPIDTELPKWGDDLGSYCERYIAEQITKAPVFITDYPATLKSFYMLRNADGITVSCCDLIIPYMGELIGSSMREHRYDQLLKTMTEKSIPMKGLEWYVDARRYCSLPTGGAGLGFERFLMTLCDTDIRDVLAVPVAYGSHLEL